MAVHVQTQTSIEALERLLKIAKDDTGQSGRVANFLLAWWNADSCGGFDLTDLWSLDQAIKQDMMTVMALVSTRASYPDEYGYRADFEQLVRYWRPHLLKKSRRG